MTSAAMRLVAFALVFVATVAVARLEFSEPIPTPLVFDSTGPKRLTTSSNWDEIMTRAAGWAQEANSERDQLMIRDAAGHGVTLQWVAPNRFELSLFVVRLSSPGPATGTAFRPAKFETEPDLPERYRLPTPLLTRVQATLSSVRPALSDRRYELTGRNGPEAYFRELRVAPLADFQQTLALARRVLDEGLGGAAPFVLVARSPLPTPASTDPAADLTPAEAISRSSVGPVAGCFRFVVRGSGEDGNNVYLNSEPDYRSPKCLTISLPKHLDPRLARHLGITSWPDLHGREIRVAGTVQAVRIYFLDADRQRTGEFYFQNHIRVTSPQQISLAPAAGAGTPSSDPR